MIINTEGNVDLGVMNALLLEEVEELTLCVIDLQGRMVAGVHAGTPQPGATITLDVKSLPAGVYVLRVTDADGREYLRKVVKK
jgi:hypothetical protein